MSKSTTVPAARPIEIGPITLTALQPQKRDDGGCFDAMRVELHGEATTIDTYEAVRIVHALSDWLQAATGVRP